jgi:hypothetical protein
MRARFIRQIGIRGRLRIYWDKITVKEMRQCDECKTAHVVSNPVGDCPNSYGTIGSRGYHNAYAPIGDRLDTDDYSCFGKEADYSAEKWPIVCEHCAAPVPPSIISVYKPGDEGIEMHHQVFTSRLYSTGSGKPEPGDIYYVKVHDPGACYYWDQCDGMHLHGVCPNGDDWDIDSRASNCTIKQDKSHRCWIRTGSPDQGTLDVSKNGNTCAAGAGSIQTVGWHGFLRNFDWVQC